MIETLSSVAGMLVLATCIAILGIALLRPCVRRGLGAVAVLRLWWILPTAMAAVLLPKEVLQDVALAPLVAGAMGPTQSDPVQIATPWPPILATLWLAGSVAMAAWYCWLQTRFTRSIAWRGDRGSLPPMHPPAVVGVLRPRLVLPQDFTTQFDAVERRLILLHEHVHMRRRDGATNMLMATLVVLQWFNPLAHWAARAIRRDQESSCDAVVVARHPRALERYASALLKALPQSVAAPLASTWQRTHNVVERIRMLKAHRDLKPRSRLASALLIGFASLMGAIAYAAKPETLVFVISQAEPASAPRGEVSGDLAPNRVAEPAPVAPEPTKKAPVAPRAAKATASMSTATPAVPDTLTASNERAPEALRAGSSFSSAALKLTSMRLIEDKVMVEMEIKDSQTNRVLARPRLLVLPGKSFAISMGRNADLLDASGTVEKEVTDDGRGYLRYRIEATAKSSSYFVDQGVWPLEQQDQSGS